MITRFFSFLFSGWILFQCAEEKVGINKFSDDVLLKIADFQDRRLSDSLYKFLRDPNPRYRKQAALSFGSIQDTMAIPQLARQVLSEKEPEVRKALAFAIGQTPSSESERILLACLIKETEPEVLVELLEAYGRSTVHWQLVKPSFFHDSIQAEGLAWSIYRAGLKGTTDSIANRVASKLLGTHYDETTRLGAAHYFSRSAKNFDSYFPVIRSAATGDRSIEVRMAAASALRKIITAESLESIIAIIGGELDPRARVNAVRALQPFSYDETKGTLFKLVHDKQSQVAITASEVLRNIVDRDNWVEVSNLTARAAHWQVIANIQAGILKASNNEVIRKEIIDTYQQSKNLYEQGALLGALQSDPGSFDFVADELRRTNDPVIASSAASCLVRMNYEKDFSPSLKAKFADVTREMAGKNDIVITSALAAAIADSILNYRAVIRNSGFLKTIGEKMNLPQDIEAVEVVETAIAYLEKRKPAVRRNEFNHPIDWQYVKSIPSEQAVVVKTSRGHITLRLFVDEAPGSVSNFLKLAESGYFDKKVFHRVVPNFVIQAGCKRGDGSGGEDYSIRSEFTNKKRYKTGTLGMASAGKDTECTQWFITLSPTPHLDGRYTIFGEVTEGMDVVNLMEIGDEIITVSKVAPSHP